MKQKYNNIFAMIIRRIQWSARRHFSHVPVMAEEILQIMRPDHGKVFIDMTFGGGGHTRKLLESNKNIKVIAVDRDPLAIEKAHELAAEVAKKCERLRINQTVIPVHGKFSQVFNKIHLSGISYNSVNGIIFDLGASSMQYDNGERGFSISMKGPLDMRMDTSCESDIQAEDVVNNLSQKSLEIIIKRLGEERRSLKVANAIIDARTLLGRIKTTQELAKVVASVCGEGIDSLGRYSHPATKTFQALRIFVNNELNELNYALNRIGDFLIPTETDGDVLIDPYGIVAILTFHSLEDRIVKRHFTGIDQNEPVIKFLGQHDRIRTNDPMEYIRPASSEKRTDWRSLFKHVKKPSDAEMAANPRSRSAKLRAAIKIKN